MAEKALGLRLVDQTFDSDTLVFYSGHHMPSTEKNLPISKGTNRFKEFLPCVQDDHCAETGSVMDLPWQFGPGSSPELDSQYITVKETRLSDIQELVTVATDIEKSTDLELEWQWIVDQQAAYTGEYFGSTKSNDNAVDQDSGDASDKNANKGCATFEIKSLQTSSSFTGHKSKVSPDMEMNKSLKQSGNLSSEWNAEKAPEKDGAVWQTADSKELAALVYQRGHGYLENCDLPPCKSSHSWNGLASCNLKTTRSGDSSSADKFLLESLLHEQEPIHSENRSLPSSHLICGFSSTTPQGYKHPSRVHPSRDSVSHPILSAPPQPSISKRFVKQTAGLSERHTELHETLGEALCHSQTRARQAENFAAWVLQEREKLAHLLCRESWTACTYKQWVKTLEWETNWLRRCSGGSMEFWRGNDPWRAMQTRLPRKKVHQHGPKPWHHKHAWIPESSSWLRCALGLAFALGLSFAGAGLMLGWSMGWILLRY